MIDTRFSYERAGHTETVCDDCHETILASEKRYETDDGEIRCRDCKAVSPDYFDPENIYNTPSMRQSIEEDRR